MACIALLAPHKSIEESARNAKARFNLDIDIYYTCMETCIQDAEKIIDETNPKIIISRGGTALLLREHYNVNVVEIKMSLADALHALCLARQYGKKVLFLGFANHIQGISTLNSLVDMEIHEKTMHDFHEAKGIIQEAKLLGFDAVVGGSIQHQVSQEVGINSILLSSDESSIYNAYTEALAILNALTIENRKMQEMRHKQYLNGLYANHTFEDIIGNSKALLEAKVTAKGYSGVDSTVLIVSESGTGKELFAQSIHNAGKRSAGPFVGINCASLSGSILESELFGYVDGAFTGAKKGGKAGIFEMANHGSIFLDEIGELDLHIQGKLLRVLQERCIMRMGDTKMIPIDVRVIAATNRNLVEDVKASKFRRDLFFRLDVLRLSIPPLRQRKEDIQTLCEFYRRRFLENGYWQLPENCMKALLHHSWPGNIRELENLMERLSIVGKDNAYQIIMRHISEMASLSQSESSPPLTSDLLQDTLQKCRGNKQKAAATLGIHRSTLYRHLEQQ